GRDGRDGHGDLGAGGDAGRAGDHARDKGHRQHDLCDGTFLHAGHQALPKSYDCIHDKRFPVFRQPVSGPGGRVRTHPLKMTRRTYPRTPAPAIRVTTAPRVMGLIWEPVFSTLTTRESV